MSHGSGVETMENRRASALLKAVLLVPKTNLHQPHSPALGLPSPGPECTPGRGKVAQRCRIPRATAAALEGGVLASTFLLRKVRVQGDSRLRYLFEEIMALPGSWWVEGPFRSRGTAGSCRS